MNEEIKENLEKIYLLIPEFECQHCNSCCGPIIWSEPEDILIKDYLYKHKIKRVIWTKEEFQQNQMRCPYLVNNRCIIYPVRPIVCRLQGNICELKCKFSNKNNFIPKKDLNELRKKYFELIKKTNSTRIFYSTLKYSYIC